MALVATPTGIADNACANLASCTVTPTNGTVSLALVEGVDYDLGTVSRVELTGYSGRGESTLFFVASGTCTFSSPSTWSTMTIPSFTDGKQYGVVVRKFGSAIVITGAEFTKGA